MRNPESFEDYPCLNLAGPESATLKKTSALPIFNNTLATNCLGYVNTSHLNISQQIFRFIHIESRLQRVILLIVWEINLFVIEGCLLARPGVLLGDVEGNWKVSRIFTEWMGNLLLKINFPMHSINNSHKHFHK